MRVGIIGAGQIGTTVAMALDRAGHDVLVSSRSNPVVLDPIAGDAGPRLRTGTTAEAASFGDVVLLAIPYGGYKTLDPHALRGRIVIDATNYFPERDGATPSIDDNSTTSSETIERYFDDVRVVKTMNTLNYLPLGQRGVQAGTEGRLALPYAGDDPSAKSLVAGLLDDMGFDTVDTGLLATGGRRQQPGSPLFNRALTAEQMRDELGQLERVAQRASRGALRIGAVFPQNEIGNDPGAIRAWAQTVEQLGYSHILAYDHVLGAGTSTRPEWRGYTSDTPFHEVFVLFGYLAAVTTSVEFVTGVLVLPQRQAALVAKQAAEVDVLSGGRLRLGVGVGWNKVEYDGLAEPFHDRGARADEQIEVLRRLWTEPTITFDGRWHHLDNAGINPLPTQRPIPIWVGGNSDAALRRAGRFGDGWFPQSPPDANARQMIKRIHDHAIQAGRTPDAVGLEPRLSLAETPANDWTAFTAGWIELGATHLCINTMGLGYQSVDQHLDTLRDVINHLSNDAHLPTK